MTPLETYEKYEREFSDLAEHLHFFRQNAKGTVMEIGVREGVSTSALLVGVGENGGHVYSVDLDDYASLYDDPNWTFIQGDSGKDHEEILRRMGRQDNNFRIDLLFIDGDHSYDACMRDLTTYGPWANIIAVHDTASAWMGVWESVISYYRSHYNGPFRRAEFLTASHGLGVLYR